jgi:hypothetical protein
MSLVRVARLSTFRAVLSRCSTVFVTPLA